MPKHVEVDKGLFSKEKIARIDDDGGVYVSDGMFSERRVATVEEDGMYVQDGMFHRKKVASTNGNGKYYDTADAGILSNGSYLGEVDASGNIRNSNNRVVGRVVDDGSKRSSSAERSASHRTTNGGGDDDGVFAAGIGIAAIPVGLWILCVVIGAFIALDKMPSILRQAGQGGQAFFAVFSAVSLCAMIATTVMFFVRPRMQRIKGFERFSIMIAVPSVCCLMVGIIGEATSGSISFGLELILSVIALLFFGSVIGLFPAIFLTLITFIPTLGTKSKQ